VWEVHRTFSFIIIMIIIINFSFLIIFRSSKKEYDVTNILKKKGVSSDLLKTIPVLSKGKNVPVKYSSAVIYPYN
jgi:hypothetical protein